LQSMKALTIAATVVFWTLVLGTAWLAYIPGSEESEPVAILQIEAIPESLSPENVPASESALVPASLQREGTAVDLPPGFAVLGPLPNR